MKGLFIRITPDDESTLDDMKAIIEEATMPDSYVLSREVASSVHYHLLVYTPFSSERVRYRIKGSISCQIYISGKDIQDKVKAIAYTIKDGHYVHKGLNIQEWMMAKQKTHKKITFEDAISTIETNYARLRNDEALVQEIIQVHIDFKKKMYRNHLKGWYDTIRIGVDDTYRNRVVKEILGYW